MSVEKYFIHLEEELDKIEKETVKAAFFQFRNTKPILGGVFNFIFLLGFLSITYVHAEPVLYFLTYNDLGLVNLSIIKSYYLLSLLAPTLLSIYYFSFRWFFNNRSKESTTKEKMKVREIAFFLVLFSLFYLL